MRARLAYKDHVFADGPACVCCEDKRAFKADPTGTKALRVNLASTIAINYRQVRVLVRQMIMDQDILSLKMPLPVIAKEQMLPSVLLATAGGPGGATKIMMFQRYFDGLLETKVAQKDGSYLRPLLDKAYSKGTADAQARVGAVASPVARARLDTIVQLAFTELQGINEAVSQQAVRAVAYGLLNRQKPMQIVRAVWDAIDKVGVVRSRAMSDFLVVKAYNDAVLDVFEAAKIKKVALVPEAKPITVKVGDAKRGSGTGPGSRISRKVQPSRSTVGRIKRAQRALERLNKVNIRTAGDDNVCPICEDIADDGPYDINTARSLIPAHPHCRCTFVPADDARFSNDSNLVRLQ